LLDTKDQELVPLHDELTFIQSYTYLLQIRFDASISFKIDVHPTTLHLLLPPMAVQLLVENVIKHNEISSTQPLTIHIHTINNTAIQVSNNLQLRSNNEISSNTGLKNISDRYSYFTTTPIDVVNDLKTFAVTLPLLHAQ
jgi:LytS/YehU family sensor histidine kinase